jgi:selenium metabolism protein YedF
MKTIDCRGMTCPKPLILTKKALNGLAAGQSIEILIDNETSKQNVERFLRDNGIEVSVIRDDGGCFTLKATKIRRDALAGDEQAYCSPSGTTRPHVICFTSDCMGNGPAELGAILMKAFVNTIKDVKPLPSHCVFYNTGVNLVVEGSTLIEPFRLLSEQGVVLLACGTCLDYFKVKDRLRAGTVSNMFTIMETLSAAGHVIKP